MHAPSAGGGHHVEMPVNQQRAGSCPRPSGGRTHCRDRARRTPGLDLVADVFQLGGNPVGTFGLALGGFELAGVGGVEPDQPADNVDHVIDRSLGGTVTVTFPTIDSCTTARRLWGDSPRRARRGLGAGIPIR